METTSDDVLAFWFGEEHGDWEAAPGKASMWFRGGADVDREIRERFGDAVRRAGAGELDGWAETPRGRLSLVVLLDQMTRNIHRGSGEAFACDERVRVLVAEGLVAGVDRELRPVERTFFYMPLMHAEDLACQDRCLALFEALSAEASHEHRERFAANVEYARRHRDVVARFGRFPHRNQRLRRESTPEEREFLKQPGSSFG